uniref:uncharacterized protein LOC122595920 n=1 Tax=Erigeron canadensis TaxID=72917 RepID=UPI001CB8D994|nr:uncharacterized protein LOC122595920 [Erigeron canadensis]
MDDDNGGGFKDRVDKVFGSITSSSIGLWSVTDGKVERREWKRSSTTRNDDEIPVSSSYYSCLNQDDADFDIRSSIGLDSTLDHEEEEDAYDKMAQGKENDADDCLFMKDVTHYGPYLNSHNVVKNHPFSSHHNASPIPRLNEDDEEEAEDDDDEPMLNARPSCFTVRSPNDGICKTKSILKRKNDEVSKPAKRVRFDPTCKNQDDEFTNAVRLPRVSNNGSCVPDYILNPSKYTRYKLDDISHHANEGSNSRASWEPKSSFGELPRSLVFIPRKKKADNSEGQQVKQSSTQAASSIAVAAQNDEASEIQGDDVCTKASKFQKPDRRYRSKMEKDDNVC